MMSLNDVYNVIIRTMWLILSFSINRQTAAEIPLTQPSSTIIVSSHELMVRAIKYISNGDLAIIELQFRYMEREYGSNTGYID